MAEGTNDLAGRWHAYLAALPDNFRSLAVVDLIVAGSCLPVHRDFLCAHSEIFANMLVDCQEARQDGPQKISLEGDTLEDVVAFLIFQYDVILGALPPLDRIDTPEQACSLVRFSHKYGAQAYLRASDQWLSSRTTLRTSGGISEIPKCNPSAWTVWDWLSFAEKFELTKMITNCELWIIRTFESSKDSSLQVSSSSLARIVRGPARGPEAGRRCSMYQVQEGHLLCALCDHRQILS